MKHIFLTLLISVAIVSQAWSFCGFYVARGDAKLFNKASQVVLVRDGNRTVLTMISDYQGELREFAMVVPVPTFIEREQIHVGDKAVVDHLDAYTAPRLVEYFDDDPCAPVAMPMVAMSLGTEDESNEKRKNGPKSLGVTVEAQYTVGEYDILILSAKESGGLEIWLKENGYKIPKGAAAVLGSYIKQNMRFFVAKVNLKEQSKLGFSFLRPLQVAYETPKFMLPIRLGTVNANGPQELFIYTLTRTGRVETTNYRPVKLPSDIEIPVYIKNDFANFYKAMFDHQVQEQGMTTVFTEYAWDMNWCDPCAADPLSPKELQELGVFWLTDSNPNQQWSGQAVDTYVTRLHVRYDAEHFPEDLVFQATSDRQNFQGRYILRQPWQGDADCDAAREYRKQLRERMKQEAQNLADLTGWKIEDISKKMNLPAAGSDGEKKWWQKMWKN